MVEVDDNILLAVTDDYEEASLLFLRTVSVAINLLHLCECIPELHFVSGPEFESRCVLVSMLAACKMFKSPYIAFFGILTAPQASPPLIYLVRFPGNRTPLNYVRLIAEVI